MSVYALVLVRKIGGTENPEGVRLRPGSRGAMRGREGSRRIFHCGRLPRGEFIQCCATISLGEYDGEHGRFVVFQTEERSIRLGLG